MRKKSKISESEYNNYVSDLMTSPNVKLMAKFTQHGTVSCLEHSMDVSYYSYLICKKIKLNDRSAARGGLLHDYFLYDWHDSPHRLHGIRHPRLALKNADKDFKLNMLEKDIIKRHMWPLTLLPPRHIESFVVSFVDKYCTIKEVLGPKSKNS